MGINDLRQTLRAELLISEPSVSEVAIHIEKFLRDKSQAESLVAVVQIGGTELCPGTHKLFGIRKKHPNRRRALVLCVFKGTMIKLLVVTTEAYHSYELHTIFYPTFFCQN